jgi:hypothetical protein
MHNTSMQTTVTTQTAATSKSRKPYHTPRLEDYGAVNELTRSGGTPSAFTDGPSTYSSNPV